MKALMASAFAVALLSITPAYALTESTCTEAWTKADENKDGSIDATEAGKYKDDLSKMGWDTMGEAPVTQANYMIGCKAK
jgi:hypothetical protein